MAAAAMWLRRTPSDVMVFQLRQSFQESRLGNHSPGDRLHHCAGVMRETPGKQADTWPEERLHPG